MKPFNLREHLKNPQRKIITRDGKRARVICVDRCGLNVKQIVALITTLNGDEIIKTYWEDGVETRGQKDNPYDLFFTPEKKEGWINIYKYNLSSLITPGSQVYNTKEEAEAAIGSGLVDYISTIKIQWEE